MTNTEKLLKKITSTALATLLGAALAVSTVDMPRLYAAETPASQQSGTEQTPGAEQQSGTEQTPSAEQPAGAEQSASTEQTPGAEQQPGTEQTPSAEQQPGGTEQTPGTTQPVQTEKTLGCNEDAYAVTVTYTADAQIPDGATLSVKETETADLNTKTGSLLNCIPSMMRYTKCLDIRILANGQPIKPAKEVVVRILLKDIDEIGAENQLKIVRFADENADPEIVEAVISEGELEIPAQTEPENPAGGTPESTTPGTPAADTTTPGGTAPGTDNSNTTNTGNPADKVQTPPTAAPEQTPSTAVPEQTPSTAAPEPTPAPAAPEPTPVLPAIERGMIVEFETDTMALYEAAVVPAKKDTYGEFVLSDFSEDLEIAYDEAGGLLEVKKGSMRISSAEGSSHTHRILLSGDCRIEIASLTITSPSGGAAITAAPGVTAEIVLGDGSYNELSGADRYAGIEAGSTSGEDDGAGGTACTLTISGGGSLKATGGRGSAGIGGSLNGPRRFGNITISSGDITAVGSEGGAGIGSAGADEEEAAETETAETGETGTTQSETAEVEEPEESGAGVLRLEGGNITADGNGGGAGIGGGAGMDSGEIVLAGARIVHAKGREGGAGIGGGRGTEASFGNGEQKAGQYFAKVEIAGGSVDEAVSEWLGAGIGGGCGMDAVVEITGGTIKLAQGGSGDNGALYQGAPGIGGGYMGNAQVTIGGEGHIVKAVGGTGAPGIGNGSAANGDNRSEQQVITGEDACVRIEGGTIDLASGGQYGAGIGTGNGAEHCRVSILGGKVNAAGYMSSEKEMSGGAGIGSGIGRSEGLKYGADTSAEIEISGGSVTATGGWGAAGIGSGAGNVRAEKVGISADAEIHAYSDGTKFALDTKSGSDKGTASDTAGRALEGVFQGTFVRLANRKFEGLTVSVTGMRGGEVQDDHKASLPEGYRSFALSVDGMESGADNSYRVRSGNDMFASAVLETEIPAQFDQSGHRFYVENGGFGDFFYLSPAVVMSATKVWVEEDGRTDKRRDVELSLVDDKGNVIAGATIRKDAGESGAAIYRNFADAAEYPAAVALPDPETQEELLLANTASADAAMSIVFDDLVKYDASGDNAIEYAIEETSIPQYRAAYVTGGTHMTITNTKESCHLTVANVNAGDSDRKITGAVFKLEIKGEDGNYSAFTGDEALEDGQFTVAEDAGYTVYDLVPGEYLLTETAAPQGYKRMTDQITFTVNKDLSINAREIDQVIQDFENMTFMVRNEEGSDIPLWKRPEAFKFYLVGAAVLAAIITLLAAGRIMRSR